MSQQGKIQTKPRNYGAVTVTDDQQSHLLDNEFNADNAYYLKETQTWTVRKIAMLLVPLCGAALIIGGAVWYLTADFNHLYPGRGSSNRSPSSGTTTIKSIEVSAPEKKPLEYPSQSSSIPYSEQTDVEKTANLQAKCSVHPGCLALTGNCCPTSEGMTLECCAT
jgi:hypothetical protein